MHIKYKIVITPTARREINRIYDYILYDLNAEKAAKQLMQKVEAVIQELKYSPKIYVRIDKLDGVKRRYRRIVIRNFVILYTVDEDSNIVYVAHMYYSGRNYLDLI
jgi:addiction module RelE/StbE family toxin